jgi:hypothetical protein
MKNRIIIVLGIIGWFIMIALIPVLGVVWIIIGRFWLYDYFRWLDELIMKEYGNSR